MICSFCRWLTRSNLVEGGKFKYGHTLHTQMCLFAFAEVTMCLGNTPKKCPKLEAACVYSL